MAAAKKKTVAKKASASQPLPGWIWLMTGLIIGLSATFFPKLNQYFNQVNEAETVVTSTELETRDFTFYTLLPEVDALTDTTPNTNTSTSTSTSTAVKQLADESILFVLQMGSFKDKQEATRLQAQLLLLGTNAHIQDVRVDGSQWFRVTIGPSQDKAHLTQVQKRLAKKRITSRLFQVRS